MNKKVLAVAVAGALALPGVALAQSSVTISGLFKVSFGQVKIGSPAAGRTGHTSQGRMTDDSSRIVFNVREDLGGGVSAIGQFDMRLAPDNGVDSGPSGNSHVGLQSASWGRIFMGRQDLHYFNTESNILVRGDLKAAPWAITSNTVAGAVANTSRTANVVHYTTPNWGGFTVIAAYSTNPIGPGSNENDIGSGIRKGRGWHLQPNMAGKNWQIGYSYWNAKGDIAGAAGRDERADRLYGSYTWSGLKVGLVWDRSKTWSQTAAARTATSNRTAWSIPVGYSWGPHNIDGHYSKARSDKVVAGSNGAKMWAIAYGYDLSKRTSAAVTFAQIKNDAAAAYNLFTSNSAAIGTPDAGVAAGEDPRILTLTLRHAF